MQQAKAAYARGEWAEAERYCRQTLATQGNSYSALMLLGVIKAQTQRVDEAASLFERAIAGSPGEASAHNNYGVMLKELGRFEDSLGSYERALTLRPDYAEAHNNRGLSLQELKRFEDALESYGRALTLKPDYAEAYNNRGLALRELKRLEEAQNSCERSLALRPGFPEACNNLGLILQELRRFEDALDSYERALTLRPDYAEAYNNRALTLRELKRFEEALDSHERALTLRPDFAEAHNARGNTLRALARFEDALKSYEFALTVHPNFAEAHFNRGNTLRELKRFADALNSLDRAIELRPDDGEAHFCRGAVLSHLDVEAALSSFRKALDCDRRLWPAYEQLGYLLSNMGRTDQAAAVYRSWLEVDPADPIAQHMCAATSGENVPERCDSRYVTSLFDRFASSFDATLAGVDYMAPHLLSAALAEKIDFGRGNLDVLDAGCGTGLCGPLLRTTARVLSGVDLSSEMLAKARARNVYDELVQAELGVFMESRPLGFDIVNCADTFIYIGKLEPVILAVRRCLRPKGWFVFTVEAMPDGAAGPYMLTATGRYAHSQHYVLEIMASVGFSDTECRSVNLRKEFNQHSRGHLFIGCVAALSS
jgi:predicted TPR repeat methyltransferase